MGCMLKKAMRRSLTAGRARSRDMFNFSGVWDEQMKHRLVCFLLTLFFIMLGYFAAMSSGLVPQIRFFL